MSKKLTTPVTVILSFIFAILGFAVGFVIDYTGFKGALVSDFYGGAIEFHFMELGNYNAGDCTLVKVGNTEVLIDAGSEEDSIDDITSYVDNYCTDGKLEYVIVTHAHEDHYACFTTEESLFNYYEIGTIIDFAQTDQDTSQYQRYLREREEAITAGAVHYTAKECRESGNYVFTLSDKVTMTILDQKFYYETSETENNHSVCTLFTCGEENFLFTGDLEHDGEKSLIELNDLPKVAMFKAGHHGSNTSNRANLMSVIQPEMVVVPCVAGSDEYTEIEANQFPTQNTINNIAPYTEKVYITGLCTDEDDDLFTSFYGDIVVSSNGKQTTVTFSNEEYLRSDGSVIELKYTEWFNNFRNMPTEWAIG